MSPVLQLRIGRGTLRAEATRRGKPVWAGEALFATPGELGEAIAALAGEASLPRKPRLRVTVEVPLVQVRALRDLPPVPGAALRSLVANQAGRFFRKEGKRLVTDAAWIRRRKKVDPPVAVAAAIEESWLDAITVGAESARLRLETISPPLELTSVRLELLSASERGRRRQHDLLQMRRLGIIAASLWLLAGALLVTRMQRERQRIERELAALAEPTAALLEVRRELGEATLMVETIDQAARQGGIVLGRLAAIASALPDSAYLTSLALDDRGGGTVTGAAPQAARVVAALDGSATVAPRLAGPAVRELVLGRKLERFSISFGPPRSR